MNRHEMTLLGLNEEFAFVSSGDETTPFDSKAAAIDLLKVRNWRGLVGFLAKHAINREMAWCWNDGLDVRRLFGGAPQYAHDLLGRSLDNVLCDPALPDYLDQVPDELCRVISIRELIHLRDALRGVTRLAAVADGYAAPDGLIALHRKSSGLIHGVIDDAMAGYRHHGLLDDQSLADGRVGEYGGIRYGSGEFEYSPDVLDDEDAARWACGIMAANAMTQIRFTGPLDLDALVYPDHCGEEMQGYVYYRDTGFYLFDQDTRLCWWEAICAQVLEAIMKGRASICENCGTPFVGERKGARTCCDSCRTELCNKRKAKPAR